MEMDSQTQNYWTIIFQLKNNYRIFNHKMYVTKPSDYQSERVDLELIAQLEMIGNKDIDLLWFLNITSCPRCQFITIVKLQSLSKLKLH